MEKLDPEDISIFFGGVDQTLVCKCGAIMHRSNRKSEPKKLGEQQKLHYSYMCPRCKTYASIEMSISQSIEVVGE